MQNKEIIGRWLGIILITISAFVCGMLCASANYVGLLIGVILWRVCVELNSKYLKYATNV
ncbi:MAG: hypothetical protein J6X18_07930 [Bacteroidales bacterium]|nr:hypothetical protein [Bacteroidales bacterium]